jgi:Ni,Fe-hydrogenase I large subunit
MPKIVVDPVTRIEGHLRIEAQVDGGEITDAWASSTMFRGIEIILKDRDPREAWLFTQRFCGVCTTVHALASVRAVENALGIEVPDNARILRNLISASQNIQDHVIHFYHLHALDWVDIVNALEADPAATSELAQSISDWPKSSTDYFTGVQNRLQAFVNSGQLGPFTNGYWGHPAYNLPPEANLMAVAHYLEALDWQREYIRIHALLGGKNPHLQTFLVGGMSTAMDPNEQHTLNADSIALMRSLNNMAKQFVQQVYLPDLLAVAPFYLEWAGIGEGVGNYLSYGDFPEANGEFFLPEGVIWNKDLSTVAGFSEADITEYVTHSWYEYDDDNQPLHPSVGETRPNYTGPQPPYEFLNTDEKYSWLKAPRLEDEPVEVGPLARMLVAYGAGHEGVQSLVNTVLGELDAGPEVLFSTLGRTAARCIETVLLSNKIGDWVDELATNMANGDLQIHANELWDPETWPAEAQGYGFHEAPRGALGHWIHIKDQKIFNYQAVVPSTWNSSPRDANSKMGPYEAALVGTPIADPERPIEILRTIHSFDPCMACGVHVLDAEGREVTRFTVKPTGNGC